LSDEPLSATEEFYILGSHDPVLPKATMVVPHRHADTPFDLLPNEWRDLPLALEMARDLLGHHAPDGYTIGWNVGAVAGQSVPHVHLHVIARFGSEPAAGKGIRAALLSLQGTGG
jgi:diadenosine tetraphosphate (Ap4A) HIT family hydrolase